jgi:hypothetical protein
MTTFEGGVGIPSAPPEGVWSADKEVRLEVGMEVVVGDKWPAVVERITDLDGDVDDEGRFFAVGPFVLVRYTDGGDVEDEEFTVATDGPFGRFICEEINPRVGA